MTEPLPEQPETSVRKTMSCSLTLSLTEDWLNILMILLEIICV